MSFTEEQQKIFEKQSKTEQQALLELERLYNRSKRDIKNQIIAEQAKGTTDSARRAIRFQGLLNEIEEEITVIQKESARIITGSMKETYRDTYNRLAYAYDDTVNTVATLKAVGSTEYMNFTFLNSKSVQEALFNPDVAKRTISPVQFNKVMLNQREALQQMVRNIISNVIATGQGLDVASKELEQLFTLLGDGFDKAKNRAMTTARTEILRAYSLAQEDSDRQAVESGVTLEYKWDTAKDEKVRSSHRQMQGQVAQLDAQGNPFFQYPNGLRTSSPRVSGDAKNVINCRCTRLSYPKGFEPTNRCYRKNGKWKQDVTNLEYRTWLSEWRKRVA